MGYHLRAILLDPAVTPPAGLPSAPLNQGVTLIPLTDDVLDAFPGHEGAASLGAWFTHLQDPLETLIGQLSQAGRVAYVEVETFGGTGTQTAAVWQDGNRTWGPERAALGPVNHALSLLGVRREGQRDEFEAVGLDRHRHLEDWLD